MDIRSVEASVAAAEERWSRRLQSELDAIELQHRQQTASLKLEVRSQSSCHRIMMQTHRNLQSCLPVQIVQSDRKAADAAAASKRVIDSLQHDLDMVRVAPVLHPRVPFLDLTLTLRFFGHDVLAGESRMQSIASCAGQSSARCSSRDAATRGPSSYCDRGDGICYQVGVAVAF